MSYSLGLAPVVKAKDQVLNTREEPTRSEPGARRKAWVLGSVLALVALLVGSVFGDRGYLNLVEKRRRVEELRGEIDSLRSENSRLAAEIVALRSSPQAIERLAREELGFARGDETVFLIREQDAPARR
jgi:cell division protein FtsB